MKTTNLSIGLILLTALFSFGNKDDELKLVFENTYPISSISPSVTNFDDLLFLADILQDKRVVILGETGHRDGFAFAAKVRLIIYLHEELGYNVIAFEGATPFGMFHVSEGIKRDNELENVLQQFRIGLYGGWSRSLEFQELAKYIGDRFDSLSIIGIDNNFNSSFFPRRFPLLLDLWFDLAQSTEIDYDEFVENYNILVTDPELFVELPSAYEQVKSDIYAIRGIVNNHVETSSMRKEYINRELDNLLSFIAEFQVDLETGIALRDRRMAENLFWAMDNFYPEEKVIIWTANFHGAKNLYQAIYAVGDDFYQRMITTGQHIADKYGEENVYSIAFTSSEREIESETEDFVIFPETTWEGRFAKKYEKGYAFIDLIPIRESEFGQKQFESTVFGRPILGKWYNIFDGYFFIRRMEFSTYDFN